jgi:hypothetical protein
LRRGLHDDAGDTWIEPAPLRATSVTRVAAAKRRGWLLPLVLALLLVAGVVVAVLASRRGGGGAPQPVTVVHTVTGPGQTVRETVTTTPTTAPSTTQAAPAGASGTALNNAGYAKMQVGDYTGALPLLQQAVQKLNGTGSLDEAYADYNLAYTTLALGQCTNVVSLLDQSQSIQGHRPEIDRLRHDAKKAC